MGDQYVIARRTLLLARELSRSGDPAKLQIALYETERVLYAIVTSCLEEWGITPRRYGQPYFRFDQAITYFLHALRLDEDSRRRATQKFFTYREMRNRTKELETPPQGLVESCIQTVWAILQVADPVLCPICDCEPPGTVFIPWDANVGHTVSCELCHEDLEIVSLDPLQLKPLYDYYVDELDWGPELGEEEEYNALEEYEEYQRWLEKRIRRRAKPRFAACPTCGRVRKIK